MPNDDPPNERDPAQGGPPPRPVFPKLTIVTPDPPPAPPGGRLSTREKYGGLFYLGTFGLAVIVAMVGWFAWQVWALRDVWGEVYALHDAGRSEAERVQAAYALSRDPRVNQRQRWDLVMRRSLPPLARYVVAESLTAEAAASDPRGYAVSVARSQGWPVWLRMILVRPLAYSAALELSVPRKPLEELTHNPDPATSLWATYALAEGPEGDPAQGAALRSRAVSDGADGRLAADLLAALDATRLPDRLKALDAATLRLRGFQPDAAKLWAGWRVEGDRLIPPAPATPAPELHRMRGRSSPAPGAAPRRAAEPG